MLDVRLLIYVEILPNKSFTYNEQTRASILELNYSRHKGTPKGVDETHRNPSNTLAKVSKQKHFDSRYIAPNMLPFILQRLAKRDLLSIK